MQLLALFVANEHNFALGLDEWRIHGLVRRCEYPVGC